MANHIICRGDRLIGSGIGFVRTSIGQDLLTLTSLVRPVPQIVPQKGGCSMARTMNAFGWLSCFASVVIMLSTERVLAIPCKQPTPAGDPCQQCRFFFDHYRKCTGSAVASECGIETSQDGWECTETTTGCPGVITEYEDSSCTILEEETTTACDASYKQATADDKGDSPICPQ